jgi:hypothetical protein
MPAPESDLQIGVRVQGETIAQISRHSNLVVTEAVDDTGRSLTDEKVDTQAQMDTLNPLRIQPQRVVTTGLMLGARLKSPARAAKTLKTLRGTIHLVLAEKSNKVTIDNPMQFYGKSIPDPYLEKMGLVIDVVPVDQLKDPPPAPQCVVLRFRTKPNNVREVSFCNGYMKAMYARESRTTTLAGDPCTVYNLEGTDFNDEMQLVLDVHPTIEDVTLPFEADNVELP